MRPTLHLLVFLLGTWFAAACARPASAPAANSSATLDSLLVDRGACYGTCDTYQIVVRRDGPTTVRRKSVEFRPKVSLDEARRLLASATAAGVLTLPARTRGDSTLCPLEASDHSTITLTAFVGSRTNRVEHYTGCYVDHDLRVAPRLERLILLERRIDADVSSTAR
ncbi:MAG TPA: hypothetical protein VGM82_19930 [Gemmatimonadaceae bacterium]